METLKNRPTFSFFDGLEVAPSAVEQPTPTTLPKAVGQKRLQLELPLVESNDDISSWINRQKAASLDPNTLGSFARGRIDNMLR